MLDDPLQLLMNQLHTAKTGLLQPLNLPLHQQLKRHLGHKKCWPWTLWVNHTHTRTPALLFTCYSSKQESLTRIWMKQITKIESQEEFTVALRMAVRMSSSVSPPSGSMDCKVRPKVSWNM